MNSTPMTDAAYHEAASRVLASIESTVDGWLQDDVVDIDSHRTGGLLELSFDSGAKLVVNMQPPLQELWLAARLGGYHFKCVDGCWLDTRDGEAFFARLSTCASDAAGRALVFEPPST